MGLLCMDSHTPESAILLFLCTGNYYRSRFAELLFNERAGEAGLAWRADSRGLALERGATNVGPISSYAVLGLQARGIVLPPELRYPLQVREHELGVADMIIALDETEHRDLLTRRFPGWAERVEYWHVPDLNLRPAEAALAALDRGIARLITRLTDR